MISHLLFAAVAVATAGPSEFAPPLPHGAGVRLLALVTDNPQGQEAAVFGGGFGGGVGAFVGMKMGSADIQFGDLQLGVDFRRTDEQIGFCLEPCGVSGVQPPLRAKKQLQLAPFAEVHFPLGKFGPFAPLWGTRGGIVVGTSDDGRDPFTFGLLTSVVGGVGIDLSKEWTFETTLSGEVSGLLVPGMPTVGYAFKVVLSGALVYRLGT